MGRGVLLLVFSVAAVAVYNIARDQSTERARSTDQVVYEESVLAREIARSGYATYSRIVNQAPSDLDAVLQINGDDGSGSPVAGGYTQEDFQGGFYRATASQQGGAVHLEVTGFFGGVEHAIEGIVQPVGSVKPPDWDFDCSAVGGTNFVDIYGVGMGDPSAIVGNPATLVIPDSASVDRIILQVTGRYANISQVHFTSSAGGSYIASTPAETGDMGMGYFYTELDPASSVAADVTTSGSNGARGFVAYVHRSRPTPYTSVGRYKFSTAYHNIHTETFEVPASGAPRDIHITYVLSDKDDDGRLVKHYATAGAVTVEQDVTMPTEGNELAITTLTLPAVPGDVTTVEVSIDSNDSIMWTMTHVYSESCSMGA